MTVCLTAHPGHSIQLDVCWAFHATIFTEHLLCETGAILSTGGSVVNKTGKVSVLVDLTIGH